MRSCVVSQFPVTLSRSRVVNYSRPKGIENATSLLRCVRNPTNPFSTLHPLSLYLLVDSNIRRRNPADTGQRWKEDEEREGRRGGRSDIERFVNLLAWVSVRSFPVRGGTVSFHGLPNIAISSTRISPTPCKHRLLANTGGAPYSIKFEFQDIFWLLPKSFVWQRSIYFVAIFLKLVRTNTFTTS